MAWIILKQLVLMGTKRDLRDNVDGFQASLVAERFTQREGTNYTFPSVLLMSHSELLL